MRRLALALLVVGLGACSSPGKDAQPKPPQPAERPAPEAQVPPSAPSPSAPLCRSLAELQQHEGEIVRLEGTFQFPTEAAFARNKLRLDDGTTVILPPERDAPALNNGNQGKRMTIRGRAFVKAIPDKYGIKGRTPDPYLFDVEKIEVAP